MIAVECPKCGDRVAAFAKGCGRCGTPNRARGAGFAVLAAFFLLATAIGVASFAVFSGQRLGFRTGEPAAARTEDFGWLPAAMRDCEMEASKAPSTLHFLVIPLAAVSYEEPRWRSKSLNDLGNAVLLPSDEALAALESGRLRISSAQYDFRVRDDSTNAIYQWSPSVGVKRFSAPDADAIEGFKIQFLTGSKPSGETWGTSFARRKGNCYWVNAVIED